MAKHTPGPWKVRDSDPLVVIAPDPDDPRDPWSIAKAYMAAGYSEGDEESHANAKLIAAAPELLAACEQLESFIGIMFGRGADAVIPETVTLPIGVPCKLGDIMRETAAAIAKAKGVTP